MSGKVTKKEIADAIASYCTKHGAEAAYDEPTDSYHLKDANGLECVFGPGIKCSSESVLDEIKELLVSMRMDSEPARGSNLPAKSGGQVNTQAAQGKGQEGFDMDSWRGKQARSYSAAGKQAPNAFAVSEEANKRGFCTQIMDSGRTKELVWGHVRVLDPKTCQYREDRVAHEKETFCLLKAWEDANSQARYQKPDQPLILGVQDNNMPELNPNVRIKGMPASLWLTMSIMRAWSFADRDAITKAERRAQLKMLNREWREDDEIVLEQEEERAVQEARA